MPAGSLPKTLRGARKKLLPGISGQVLCLRSPCASGLSVEGEVQPNPKVPRVIAAALPSAFDSGLSDSRDIHGMVIPPL